MLGALTTMDNGHVGLAVTPIPNESLQYAASVEMPNEQATASLSKRQTTGLEARQSGGNHTTQAKAHGYGSTDMPCQKG